MESSENFLESSRAGLARERLWKKKRASISIDSNPQITVTIILLNFEITQAFVHTSHMAYERLLPCFYKKNVANCGKTRGKVRHSDIVYFIQFSVRYVGYR